MAGIPYFSQGLTSRLAVGTLYNTYTTAKSVINKSELLTLPQNYFRPGTKLRVTARGALSNVVTTPGNVFFQVMIGSVIAWTSGNLALNATARTLLPFSLKVDLDVDSVGDTTTAKLLGMGEFGGVHLTNTDATVQVPATAPAVGTGFDSSVANVLDFWVGFSNSQAGNGVQIYQYCVEQLFS